MGLVYTYIGLVLFLTGANVGFMPAGHYLGQQLASYKYSAVVIPVAMVMGPEATPPESNAMAV